MLVPAAFAQTTAELRGTLVDPSGDPVPELTVVLENDVVGFRMRRTSGTDGTFSFRNLPLGAYKLSIESDIWERFEQEVSARTNVPVEVAITLRLAGDRTSITVHANAADLVDPQQSGTRAQINQLDIERIATGSGSRGLEAALVRFPGFAKNANGAIHPRGAHNQMTFVVDGIPISDQLNGAFANSLDPSVAQTVELSTGNISAEFFGKTGAVAVITTRSGMGSGRRFAGSTAVDAAQFDMLSQTTQAMGESGRFGFSSAITTTKTHRFLDQVSLDNLHNGGNSQRGFTRLDMQATDKDVLRLTVMSGRSSFELANLRSQQQRHQEQRQWLGDVSVGLGWVRALSARSTLDATLSYRTGLARLLPSLGDTPVTADQARHLTTISTGLRWNYVTPIHAIRIGWDNQHFPVSERFHFGITGRDFNGPTSPGFNPNLLPYDLSRGGSLFRFAQKRAGDLRGFFGEDHVHLGALTLALGVRYDNYRFLVNADQWQPRLGLAYAITATGTVFRLSYNRLLQTPPNENLLLSASPEAARLAPPVVQTTLGGIPAKLRPERQNVFEAGLQQALGTHVSLNAAVYHKDAVDQQDNNNFLNTGVIFPITLKSIRVNGAEARLNVLPVHGVSGSLSATHSRSISTPPFTGGLFLGNEAVDALSQGPFVIDHDQFLSLHLAMQYTHRSGLWITSATRYDSGLVANPSDPTQVAADPDHSDLLPYVDLLSRTARVRPRTIQDLSLGFTVPEGTAHRRWEASLQITNLTNRTALYNFQSIFVGTRLVAPRTFGIRLRWFF